jgi:hypothetical protein
MTRALASNAVAAMVAVGLSACLAGPADVPPLSSPPGFHAVLLRGSTEIAVEASGPVLARDPFGRSVISLRLFEDHPHEASYDGAWFVDANATVVAHEAFCPATRTESCGAVRDVSWMYAGQPAPYGYGLAQRMAAVGRIDDYGLPGHARVDEPRADDGTSTLVLAAPARGMDWDLRYEGTYRLRSDSVLAQEGRDLILRSIEVGAPLGEIDALPTPLFVAPPERGGTGFFPESDRDHLRVGLTHEEVIRVAFDRAVSDGARAASSCVVTYMLSEGYELDGGPLPTQDIVFNPKAQVSILVGPGRIHLYEVEIERDLLGRPSTTARMLESSEFRSLTCDLVAASPRPVITATQFLALAADLAGNVSPIIGFGFILSIAGGPTAREPADGWFQYQLQYLPIKEREMARSGLSYAVTTNQLIMSGHDGSLWRWRGDMADVDRALAVGWVPPTPA